MMLLVAGVACLAVSSAWHVGLAVWSRLEASRWAAGASSAGDRVPPGDASSAAPTALWLVLLNPAPAALAAVGAVGSRLRCRTRPVVVVADPSRHEPPDHADAHPVADGHRLVVSPRLDRAEVLNRAYRLIRARCRDYGEDPARTVIGVIEANAALDESSAVAVWRAFGEPGVGAVQARLRIGGAGGFGAVEHYERGVLADAVNLVRSRWGQARLGATGAFVRLSALSRLGPRPWRPGMADDHGLSVRLRRVGVLVRHCPGIQVSAAEPDRPGIVRRSIRAAQGRLSPPSPGIRRWERVRWALHLAGWLLPGLVVLWAVAAFAATAWRLLRAVPAPPADAARWSTLIGTALGLDTPSWWAFLQAAAPWAGAAVAPVVVWRAGRRDVAVGLLVRGTLGRPLLLAMRPAALGLAVGGCWWKRRVGETVGRTAGPVGPVALNRPREKPVFVDVTGRRNRRVWMVAYGSGLAGLAYVIVLGWALGTGQITPYLGDPPRIDYPKPTPNPPATPAPVEEPVATGVGRPPNRVDTLSPTSASGPALSVSPSPATASTGLDESSGSPEPFASPSPSPAEPEETTPPPSPSPSPSASPSPDPSPSPTQPAATSPPPSPSPSPSPNPSPLQPETPNAPPN